MLITVTIVIAVNRATFLDEESVFDKDLLATSKHDLASSGYPGRGTNGAGESERSSRRVVTNCW